MMEAHTSCDICGEPLPKGAKFCSGCGNPFREGRPLVSIRGHEKVKTSLIKCPDCGRQVSDDAIACPNCGKIIGRPVLERMRQEVAKEEAKRKAAEMQREAERLRQQSLEGRIALPYQIAGALLPILGLIPFGWFTWHAVSNWGICSGGLIAVGAWLALGVIAAGVMAIGALKVRQHRRASAK
jgi:DNA-directed RNA polymerase subunit RPC12/RpoP